jgi:di/tricarboxylate transporter
MTSQIALLLGILAVAIVFFVWEIVSAEVVALGILLALAMGGLVPPAEVFAGFGSDTVLMILGLLILTAALERTGLVDLAGRAVLTHAGSEPKHLFLLVIVASCILGAFISNTATTAFFLPVALGISRKSGMSPATLLMPLAFSSILSSSVTLVSTSTNLVVSGFMTHYQMEPMGMFEMAPVGVPIALVGLAYVYFSRKWIPDRVKSGTFTETFGLKDYLSEVVILPGSRLADKSLQESRIEEVLGLQVLRVIRAENGGAGPASRSLVPRGNMVLHEGDLLIVEGSQEDILKVKDAAGVEIKADIKLTDPSLADEDIALVEGLVMPRSRLIGQTLKLQRFRERYGPQVLGINRHGVISVKQLSQTPIALGDTLLLQGRPEDIVRMHESGVVRITSPMEALAEKRPRQRHALLAVTIFVGVLALATLKVLSLPLAVMLGAFLVFVTGCIRPQEAYAMVEWKAVILIGSILSLGSAMDHTGTAQYIAGALVSAVGNANPYWLLTAFFTLSVLLTQPMSNQAAAVVVMPVAVHTAMQAGLSPRAFAMMVAVASSCSYLTPLEPACLMVHGPGQYRFMDFFKIGFPLTFLIYIIAILMVPWLWPLR